VHPFVAGLEAFQAAIAARLHIANFFNVFANHCRHGKKLLEYVVPKGGGGILRLESVVSTRAPSGRA
jgi:hypothetical protein